MHQEIMNYLLNSPTYNAITQNVGFQIAVFLLLAVGMLGFFVFCIVLLNSSKETKLARITYLSLSVMMMLCVAPGILQSEVDQEMYDRYAKPTGIVLETDGYVRTYPIDPAINLQDGQGVTAQYESLEGIQRLGRMECSGSIIQCNDLLQKNREEIVTQLIRQKKFAAR